jgi:hypothetical protein
MNRVPAWKRFNTDIFFSLFFESETGERPLFYATSEFFRRRREDDFVSAVHRELDTIQWIFLLPFEIVCFVLHCVFWYLKMGWESFADILDHTQHL